MKKPVIITMLTLAIVIQATGFVGASYWCAERFGDGYVALSILGIAIMTWFVIFRSTKTLVTILIGSILYGVSINLPHHDGVCLISGIAGITYLPLIEIALVERHRNRRGP